MCYENSTFTQNLVSTLEKGIDTNETNEFRIYFACFKKLLALKDSLQIKRIDLALKSLLKVI